MPKDEFDFADPFELNGMAFLTHEDTTDAMAETFIEEFMRMGHGHKQILALFRNPHYLGPNMALEKRGEPFIRDLITEVFARWGKQVEWPNAAASPLTAALSPSEGERENRPPSNREPVTADCTSGLGLSEKPPTLSPLLLGGGEGQGEGARGKSSLTDPTGVPIPEYTV
ncbi:MAG: hypothetical protein KIS67_24725 [Verrucomicrobiae bacterium]|nr:hypothetical protein [Verrucomicrobiae bacterium]